MLDNLDLFSGGHEMVHHDSHLHEIGEGTFHFQDAADNLMQSLTARTEVADLLHHVHSLPDTHDLHSQNLHSNDFLESEHSSQGTWHDVGDPGDQAHLHLLRHSEAHDSNGDGVSDAASRDLGIGSVDGGAHQSVSLDWHDAGSHLHHSHSKDSDGDGWTDDVEQLAGTDPYNAASHPFLVEAHHFPAGSGENLPGTVDVTPSAAPWLPV